MQDIHSIGSGGGVGRLFGGGERRLKPHHHHHQGYADGHQALKCPRCDSLNTKFCYYNNYNLSQPRHFCKGCRRYWTKGGVLRNVPVGGGCRKTKRSKQKFNNSKPSSLTVAPTSERKSADSQNSCSDSSSLTANTTAVTATTTEAKASTVAEVLSGSNSTNSAAQPLFNFQESSTTFYNAPQSSTPNPGYDLPVLDQCSADHNHMFSEIGTFRSLITSSSDQLPLDFNAAPEISSFMHKQAQKVADNPNANLEQWLEPTADDVKMQEIGSAGFMDQTGQVEYSRTSNGGLAAEDWQGDAEQSLFDLPGSVDQSYWGEIPWNNDDHQLNYFP